MRGILRVDGKELGVSNSQCMVLETVIEADTSVRDQWGMCIMKNRLSSPKGADYVFFCTPKNPNDYCMAEVFYHDGVLMCDEYCKIYAYRRINHHDKVRGTGVNIYNDQGGLFYSSSVLPLQITQIIDVSGEVMKMDPDWVDGEPVYSHAVVHPVEPGSMVSATTCAQHRIDLYNMVFCPNISNRYNYVKVLPHFHGQSAHGGDTYTNYWVRICHHIIIAKDPFYKQ
ncbi:hypothetical protein [Xenorhabdus indica]|uniref:hypothetical protein n=1 Tax=Xenorhabdus indica TaxID=333964 RepID=UPI001656B232|nr:hypothetical protein [Xenorhabdus indica]MBC8946980.1 hypothetical protein [Xenorhabdus indica]